MKLASFGHLPPTATIDVIEGCVAGTMHSIAETAKVLGLAEAPLPEALAAHAREALSTRQTQTAGPDPTKFVPMEQFRAVNDRLGAIETRLAGDTATRAVDAAMAAGKIIPATKDWALAYASKDLAGFEAFAKTAPVIVKPGRQAPAGQPPVADGELDEAAGAVIYFGALIVLNSSGYAEPATTATGKKGLGRADAAVSNAAGADGAVTVPTSCQVTRNGPQHFCRSWIN